MAECLVYMATSVLHVGDIFPVRYISLVKFKTTSSFYPFYNPGAFSMCPTAGSQVLCVVKNSYPTTREPGNTSLILITVFRHLKQNKLLLGRCNLQQSLLYN